VADELDETEPSALWEQVHIDPVEIALPAGVGYTLRAYRMSNELAEPEPVASAEESAAGDDLVVAAEGDDAPTGTIRRGDVKAEATDEDDEDEDARDKADDKAARGKSARDKSADDKSADDEDDEHDEQADEQADEDDEEDEAEEEVAAPEEVPVFLSRRGKVLLFKSPEGLVDFVRSDAPHELAQLDTWAEFVEAVTPADIDPADADRYELDLVTENLRGGHDTWSPGLIISAGEVTRDLAHALRLRPVIEVLAPGSPLDDLDEALRAAESGGLGGLFAKRRLKKIGAQQAYLAWRTIIGKISAAVDWRD